MILKVRDEGDFNLSLRLNINYDMECIEVIVYVQNKRAHTAITKTYKANDFHEALSYFEQQERFLFGKKEG